MAREEKEDIDNQQCDTLVQQSYLKKEKGNLKNHIESVHEQLKAFKCSNCDYSTSRKSNLTIHISSVHEKNKPYR